MPLRHLINFLDGSTTVTNVKRDREKFGYINAVLCYVQMVEWAVKLSRLQLEFMVVTIEMV